MASLETTRWPIATAPPLRNLLPLRGTGTPPLASFPPSTRSVTCSRSLHWVIALALVPPSTTLIVAAEPPLPLSTFRTQLNAASQRVAACSASAAACLPTTTPQSAEIAGQDGISPFHADWQWLAEALRNAATAPPPARVRTMDEAAAHLAEIAAQTAPPTGLPAVGPANLPAPAPPLVQHPLPPFAAVRQRAAGILASPEFRPESGPGWFDHGIALLEDALLRLFSGMGRLGGRNPWLTPLIEWLCFGLAAAALLLSIRRSLRRQALQILLNGSAPAHHTPTRSAGDWLHAADTAQNSGDLHEALRCLYWAGIETLESHHAWRHNPTRTPREYLRLLRPGSAAQAALGGLTRRFERGWYGSDLLSIPELAAARQDLKHLQALGPALAADLAAPTSVPASPWTSPQNTRGSHA